MKARVVLPGEAELDEAAVGRAVAGEAGREYVVLGELLRVWVVLEGCERGELPVLEVFARFEEADKKMGDAELSERKPRHVPCARQEGPHRDGSVVCQSGWRGEMFGERAVLYQDVPVLLRHGLAGDTLRLVVSVKTPAFAAGPRLDDMERLLSSSSYAERQSRQCEAWLAVKVACLPHLEVVGPQLAHSHTAVLCVSVRNCDSSVPMVFHHLSLSEGSTRYNGPAGMQSVAFGELFALHVEEERDAEVGPQDAVQVLARLQPRPLAFVQYTDWEGSFSGRLVATWSAPGVRGRVMSWLDVAWKGPRSNDLLVQCQCPPPARVGQQFGVSVTVNNLSDSPLTLTLGIGGSLGGGLLCLDHSVVLGTLTAKSKTGVAVRFVGLLPGVHTVDNVRLTDMQGETHVLVEPWQIQIV